MANKDADIKQEAEVIGCLGYVSDHILRVEGRLIEQNELGRPQRNDSIWKNLWNNAKRFRADGIPDEIGSILIQGQEFDFETDENGYFRIETTEIANINKQSAWMDYEILIPEFGIRKLVTDAIHYPSPQARFGIISDIDDTVMHSNVSSKWKTLLKGAFANAYSRVPIAGVTSIYRYLSNVNTRINPVFYVSRSPWQIYDMLFDFFKVNQLPKGPIFLRDIKKESSFGDMDVRERTKYRDIQKILLAFPELPMLCFGDSTESDAFIYLELARMFPNQIKHIYIRVVEENDRFSELKEEMQDYRLNELIFFFKEYHEVKRHLLQVLEK